MLSLFASLVAVCLVVSTAQSADVPVQSTIVNGPLNDAVEFGPGIVLNCDASGPFERVQWFEYTQGSSGNQISENGLVLPGNPNAPRYSIVNPPGTATYNLEITPTLLEDGGKYECRDISDQGVSGFAEIITLSGSPNCTTNIPENGFVREGEYYTVECIIGYRGNVPPKMTWSGPSQDRGTWIQASTTTNVTVWSGVAMTMTRFFDAFTFSVLTNFTEDGFINLPDSATNVPTWSHTFSTAELYVQWAPQRMYRDPEQDTYEIGDFIECWADANPSATYYWRNIDTLQTYPGQRIDLTEEWVGSWRMQCHAENVIGGVPYTNDYFFNLTVNARTTTPEPTTPTTTTPPPAEAPCDDLTGRWTATSPSLVDMCISINNANNGRIVGLFRNATDPYFIEIRGRVVPYKYNQVGFTGVWPVNIGTLAFGGICRKCYGTEVLQVTAVGRKVTDNPSCQNPGPTYRFADYAFRRTGPPCTALFEEYNIKL